MPPAPAKPAPCKVPVDPQPPELDPQVCNGEWVCLTVAETIALGRYLTARANVESALSACNLIVRVPN